MAGIWKSVKGMFKAPPEEVPRAPRFAHEGPLRFRPAGQGEWYPGTMFNISQTGVVFRTDRVMDVNAPIEMNFVLPAEIAGKEGAVVFCRGEVVRTARPKTDDKRPLIAATILEYLPGSTWKPHSDPPKPQADPG
jgi:hypothetical protein